MYKLIIVDDEEKILDGVAKLFPWESIGFQVSGQFTHARLALDFLETQEADVVMCDIEMPDMDGIEFCGKLLERKKQKIVLFSSHRNYEYFRAAIQNGVEDYLLKPIEYSILLQCFERIKEKLDEERKIVREVPQGYYDQMVRDVEAYLNASYQNASLEEAAGIVNLSPTYLSKIFKEKSGTSFSDRLLAIRMKKAKEMLDDIQYKSYEIAYDLGYDNPKNFSRAFKAYFQVSPSEYRNRRREGK